MQFVQHFVRRSRRAAPAMLAFVLILLIASACSSAAPAPALPAETQDSPAATAAPSATAAPENTNTPLPASDTPAPSETPVPERPTYDTEFPLPADVQNFMKLGDEAINYQTNLSLEEVVAFYREALSAQGLSERELLTVIDDTAFSMVFDGAANNLPLVVQGVDLGQTTNVNVRYEDF